MADAFDMNALAAAIGGVAINSALSDDRLRFVAAEFAGEQVTTSVLFEGQSTEWLINAIKAMLDRLDRTHEIWPLELHEKLSTALRDMRELTQHRNTVIHGTWVEPSNHWRSDMVKPRPWGNMDDTKSIFCMRSRYRSFGPPMLWTVSDVDLLADKIADASETLMYSYALMFQHRWPNRVGGTLHEEWLENYSG